VSKASLIAPIQKEIERQINDLPRKAIAERALVNSRVILLDSQTDAIDFVNEYAPEHLIINTKNTDEISSQITNAGSIFLGNYSPEAIGDYASGTNHTLPTNGYAKAFAGVALESFMKYITYQRLTEEGISALGPAVELMAEAEQLIGHKMAIKVRLDSLSGWSGLEG